MLIDQFDLQSRAFIEKLSFDGFHFDFVEILLRRLVGWLILYQRFSNSVLSEITVLQQWLIVLLCCRCLEETEGKTILLRRCSAKIFTRWHFVQIDGQSTFVDVAIIQYRICLRSVNLVWFLLCYFQRIDRPLRDENERKRPRLRELDLPEEALSHRWRAWLIWARNRRNHRETSAFFDVHCQYPVCESKRSLACLDVKYLPD